MGLIDSQAVDRAFRSGLMAEPDCDGQGLQEDIAIGPGEMEVLRTKRLAGLASSETAFETGRTLRLIARLFDQAGAPARITEQFRDNLGAAIMGEAMRAKSTWTMNDTIDMFIDLYTRILDPEPAELDRTRSFLEERVLKPVKRRTFRDKVGGWLGRNS